MAKEEAGSTPARTTTWCILPNRLFCDVFMEFLEVSGPNLAHGAPTESAIVGDMAIVIRR